MLQNIYFLAYTPYTVHYTPYTQLPQRTRWTGSFPKYTRTRAGVYSKHLVHLVLWSNSV